MTKNTTKQKTFNFCELLKAHRRFYKYGKS